MTTRKQFTLGAIAGMTTLALAVPFVVQIAGAQGFGGMKRGDSTTTRPVPTQECVEAMATMADLRLANFDMHSEKQKERLAAEVTALQTAAAITDDTARMEALKAAHEKPEDFKEELSEEMTAAMTAVRTACGGGMGGKGPGFGGGHMMRGAEGGRGHGMPFMHGKPEPESDL